VAETAIENVQDQHRSLDELDVGDEEEDDSLVLPVEDDPYSEEHAIYKKVTHS